MFQTKAVFIKNLLSLSLLFIPGLALAQSRAELNRIELWGRDFPVRSGSVLGAPSALRGFYVGFSQSYDIGGDRDHHVRVLGLLQPTHIGSPELYVADNTAGREVDGGAIYTSVPLVRGTSLIEVSAANCHDVCDLELPRQPSPRASLALAGFYVEELGGDSHILELSVELVGNLNKTARVRFRDNAGAFGYNVRLQYVWVDPGQGRAVWVNTFQHTGTRGFKTANMPAPVASVENIFIRGFSVRFADGDEHLWNLGVFAGNFFNPAFDQKIGGFITNKGLDHPIQVRVQYGMLAR